MIPGQIIALARDALLIAGVGFVVWWVWHDGRNSIKVSDMQAVEKQIASNAQQEAIWAAQRQQAEVQHGQDIAAINAAISAHSAPIIVRVPASTGPVSSDTTAAVCPNPASGGADAGSGINIRPAVNAFEQRWESTLADCRQVIESWPH